jgi:L-seryl-tRNA(Ser) seleniumtransferase
LGPNRRPPSVERLLSSLAPEVANGHGREAVVDAAREVVDAERRRLTREDAEPRAPADLAGEIEARLGDRAAAWSAGATSAINATGVLIHTNLGRSTWPAAAIEAARAAAEAPILLELDAATGRRGRRYRAAEDALVALTGAEDALVTNNNAAAIALAVGLAGRGGGVIVSRGELVEIGGGVRIPEIVRRAGAKLIEVGTTNRTRAEDFEASLSEGRARLVLRVHRSNFRLEGFVEDPDFAAVAALAHEHGAIVVDDLGSGALLDTARFGLPHEPLPAERLAAGADIVTFSGDKLVGGPQAGLVVGRADLIAKLRKDPLARAMRPDKVTLAAVAATLGLYRAGRAEVEIPLWRAVATPVAELETRARRLTAALGGVAEGVPTEATFGGGALPGEVLASFGIALTHSKPDALAAALRTRRPAVIGRIEDRRVLLDLRTIEPERDAELEVAVRSALSRVAGDADARS